MSRTILIVDDSKLARMAVAKLLSKLCPEWKRLEASNADEAIAALPNNVDIVLLDFNMPGRDGLELAGDLKKLYPDMPVAVISANMQQEVIARAKDAGATFLSKPVSEDALGAFIAEASSRLEHA